MLLEPPEANPPVAGQHAGRGAWPPEVDMILSAMEVARSSAARSGFGVAAADRRDGARQPYRTRAQLKLYADPADAPPAVLYTRDADRRGVGFITPTLLPLGYGGWVTLQAPDGQTVRVECTVYRCRRTVQGWFEGALSFHRDVWQLGQGH